MVLLLAALTGCGDGLEDRMHTVLDIPTTGVTGLAVVLYPQIHGWMVARVRAVSLAVDEKWLKIHKAWQYWCVAVDEATGLPVAMALLSTRTTWACW